MSKLLKSDINGYYHPEDPGEPGFGETRLSINDIEGRILAEFARGKTVLEIGTGLGVSARHMAVTANKIYTVDIDPWVEKEIAPTLPENVEFRTSAGDIPSVDMCFVDGWHTYEETKKDIAIAKSMVFDGGLIIVHDARISGVLKALQEVGFIFIDTVAGMGMLWA